MKKSELRKLIREVISEQDSIFTTGTPQFFDLGDHLRIQCPAGFKFADNLPNGAQNPEIITGMTSVGIGVQQFGGPNYSEPAGPFMSEGAPTEAMRVSKCVPSVTVDDLPKPQGGPIGKPGTEGGTKVPAQRRKR